MKWLVRERSRRLEPLGNRRLLSSRSRCEPPLSLRLSSSLSLVAPAPLLLQHSDAAITVFQVKVSSPCLPTRSHPLTPLTTLLVLRCSSAGLLPQHAAAPLPLLLRTFLPALSQASTQAPSSKILPALTSCPFLPSWRNCIFSIL